MLQAGTTIDSCFRIRISIMTRSTCCQLCCLGFTSPEIQCISFFSLVSHWTQLNFGVARRPLSTLRVTSTEDLYDETRSNAILDDFTLMKHILIVTSHNLDQPLISTISVDFGIPVSMILRRCNSECIHLRRSSKLEDEGSFFVLPNQDHIIH